MKKIIMISDHGGFELKEALKKYFDLKGYVYEDLGPTVGTVPISYATQGLKLAKFIAKDPENLLGIAICGTGIGISIAVNRVKGIRGARITSIADAKMAKKHNNANILVIGGRTTTTKKAMDMFNAFIREEFEGGRHISRICDLDSSC